MRKQVIFLLLLALILLPSLNATEQDDEFQKEFNKALYYAKQYDAGNIGYAELLVNLNTIRGNLNAILLKAGEKGLIQETLDLILSKSYKTAPQFGTNKIIFDGFKCQIQTTTLFKETSYQTDFIVNLKETKTTIDLKKEIEEVETLVKTYTLKPEDLEVANQLAEKSINIENLFEDYFAQSEKTCEEIMAESIGTENKITQNLITRKYTISDKDNYQIYATLTLCKECESGTWASLDFEFIKDNLKRTYIISQETDPEIFKGLEGPGFKKEFITSHSALREMIESENYVAAYAVATRMEIAENAWATLKNKEAFSEKLEFFLSLFEGYPVTTEEMEQITFEKILVQTFEEGKEEICNNKVDDNENELIDCEEEICAGQICGTTLAEDNETMVELYCIEGKCQLKQEIQENKGPVCGNKICEENEIETCSEDCIDCPTYDSIDCDGKVIFKGKDSRGCNLEPVCITQSKTCTLDEDCAQPLCGIAQCINNLCQTTEFKECSEKQCNAGETKSQKCSSGETIISELCSNGIWKKTGIECGTAVSGATKTVETTSSQACKVAEDCKENHICENGKCLQLAIKNQPEQEKIQETIKAIGITGEFVKITSEGITSEGITSVIGEEPDLTTQVKDYKRPKDYEGKTNSFLTGIARQESEEEITEDFTIEQTAKGNLIEEESIYYKERVAELEKTFVVKGICTTTPQGTDAILYFSGSGEELNIVPKLQERYNQDGTLEDCSRELQNQLKQRREFEKSFNQEFIRNFVEEYLANSADNWEGAANKILSLHENNVNNIEKLAKAMDCLGFKKLEEEFKLVDLEYITEEFTIKYRENLNEQRFDNMINKVEIPIPKIEMSLFFSEEFIKKELKNAMENHEFTGSPENIAQREKTKGLLPEEKTKIMQDSILMQNIRELTSKYPDGNLNFQLTVVDSINSNQIVYNAFGVLNEEDILKFKSMPPEESPAANVRIEVGFQELYDIMQTSREYKQDSPWGGTFSISNIFEATIDWIKMRSLRSNLMGSVKVHGSDEEKIKNLFRGFLYEIGGNSETEEFGISQKQTKQIIWDSKGTSKITS